MRLTECSLHWLSTPSLVSSCPQLKHQTGDGAQMNSNRRQPSPYSRGLPDVAWIIAWVLLTALLAYVVILSVLSSDLDNLKKTPSTNSKGIVCGSSPHAAVSTLMFFSYGHDSLSLKTCIAECPSQQETNLTICNATMVSTAYPPLYEVPVPCGPQTFNMTAYATQQVLQFCVPDPDTDTEVVQSQFVSTAKSTFRYETAEAAVAIGPWQTMYTLSVTVAAVDCILLFLCLLLACTGRSVAGAVAVYGSVNLACIVLVTAGMWLQPSKVVWKAAETAWALRLPYVRWLTLFSQALVSLLACLSVSQLISVHENLGRTQRAIRCAFSTRLLSSVAEVLNSSPEVWILPALACMIIQSLTIAITVPAATYAYAHTRTAQLGPISWIPKEYLWAQHAVVGSVALLFIFFSWWTLGSVVAYCRALSASTVRAHYHARGTGTSLPRRALVKAASQLLQRHPGSLLGVVILIPVSWVLKVLRALFMEEDPSMALFNVTNETALSGLLVEGSCLLSTVKFTHRVLQLSTGRVGLAEHTCVPWASAGHTCLLWLGMTTYMFVQLFMLPTWPAADLHLLPMILAGVISTSSILPLTAVVEQAASTLVVCFCEATCDHEVNGSVFRRLVLPPHLHSCLNDSLNITVQYQAHQQHLARERAEQQALEAQEVRAQAAVPAAPIDMGVEHHEIAVLDSEDKDSGPRHSVAFGMVHELRRSTIRSAASVFPATAMRAAVQGHDDDVSGIW